MKLTYYINHHGNPHAPVHQNPLHLAAYFDLPWLVEIYLSQDGTFVDTVATTNDTPLIWASEMGSTACVKKLLDAGADPNQFEYDGWSGLHWAARNGHLEIIKLLLEYGARLDQRDSNGDTPLAWAIDRNHSDVVSVLEHHTDEEELRTSGTVIKQQGSKKGALSRGDDQFRGRLWNFRP
jgi:ankyrin repeat protein